MKIINIFIFLGCLSRMALAQDTPANTAVKKDIVYKTINGWEGKLDLYLPKTKGKNALVFYVHGGGWTHGNKEAEYEKIKVFIENGFAVANIEYRLARQAPAPAAVEDVYCALVYLLKHANDYKIDTKKVILMGGSAGGHLALLVGFQAVQPVYNGGCKYPGFKAAGIISKYGPTDVLTWEPARKIDGASAAWLGDKINNEKFIKTLSPVNYVSKEVQGIPVLFVHGKNDKTVPIQQAEILYQKLKQNGNDAELHIVENGKHGNFAPEDNVIMDAKMIAFVKKCIR